MTFAQIFVMNFDHRSRALTGTCLIVGANVLEVCGFSGRGEHHLKADWGHLQPIEHIPYSMQK